MMSSFLNDAPLAVLIVGNLLLLLFAFELGHQSTKRRAKVAAAHATAAEAGTQSLPDASAHVGVLLGALLGLLGLMLGFSFHICEGRFQTRKQLVLSEANTIATTYLRAGVLPEELNASTRALLLRYLKLRTKPLSPATVPQILAESQSLHRQLWSIAEQASHQDVDNTHTPLFIQSLNELIDRHQDRVTVGLHQRIPGAIILTLALLAALSAFVLGYGTGLLQRRLFPLAIAVLAAVSLVISLIIDLDRPWQQMFRVGQDPMMDTAASLHALETPRHK